jgi:hypothetical protein
MSKPVYKSGSSGAYKKNRMANGDIIRVSAELSGSPMEEFNALRKSLGCGAGGVIQHLLKNYHSPMISPNIASPIEVKA